MNPYKKNPWIYILLFGILVVAFASRFIAGVYWENRYARGNLYYGDSPGYWTLAESLAHFQPYRYGEYGRIFRTPGYPAVLASGMFVCESVLDRPMTYWEGRVLGMIIGVGCVWLLFKIGSLAFGPLAGLFAAFWGAIYPEFVLLSVMILADSLFCLLFLAQLYFWVKTFRTPQRCGIQSAIGAGIFAGFACLTRPGWLYFTPIAAILMAVILFAFSERRKAANQLISGFVMTACCFGILFPWAARNYCVSGNWIWTTCQGGPSLWDGLNPEADGGSCMDFMSDAYREAEAAVTTRRQAISGLFRQDESDSVLSEKGLSNEPDFAMSVELEVNRMLTCRSFERIQTDFAGTVRLALNKFSRTWSLWPNQNSFRSLPIRLVFSSFYLLLMIFSIFGLIRARQNREFCLLFLMIAGYFVLLHLFFVGSLRYRQPVLWIAAVFWAWGVIQAVGFWFPVCKSEDASG